MSIETVLFWLLLGLLSLPLLRARMPGWGLLALVVGLAGGSAHWWSTRDDQRARAAAQLAESLPGVRRQGGYVSSELCRSCHPDEYESWHRTYHRTMTQRATPDTVRGRFAGKLVLEGRSYQLEQRDDEFWMTTGGEAPRRVLMVTGSHHMQVYWTKGPPGGNSLEEFPFTYLIGEQQWVPRRDVFLIGPDYPKGPSTWNHTCIECHTTAPQPRIEPESGVTDSRVAELGISCESCHGPAYDHVRAQLNPLVRLFPSFFDPDLKITQPAKLSAERANQVCGQCHGVTCKPAGWHQDGLPYHPGEDLERTKPLVQLESSSSGSCRDAVARTPGFADSRFWKDGMVRVSGREYNAVTRSPCAKGKSFSCLSCHSLHQAEPNDLLAEGNAGDRACLQCHPKLGENIPAHTHHAAGSAGSECMNCHMPYTAYSLLTAIRSHQVDSPTVKTELATGRPTACTMCHLDRSLAWTADALRRWYGIDAGLEPAAGATADVAEVPASLRGMFGGDAGQRVLYAWAMGWASAQRAAGTSWMAPHLADLLEDPYAAVRFVALRSLRTLPGFEQFDYDYTAAADQRHSAHLRAVEIWRAQRQDIRPGLLLDASGQPDGAAISRLRDKRPGSSLFLAE